MYLVSSGGSTSRSMDLGGLRRGTIGRYSIGRPGRFGRERGISSEVGPRRST